MTKNIDTDEMCPSEKVRNQEPIPKTDIIKFKIMGVAAYTDVESEESIDDCLDGDSGIFEGDFVPEVVDSMVLVRRKTGELIEISPVIEIMPGRNLAMARIRIRRVYE